MVRRDLWCFVFNFLLFLVENLDLEGFVELIRFLFGLETWSPARMVLNLQLPLMFSSRHVLIRVILYNTIVPFLLVGKLCSSVIHV